MVQLLNKYPLHAYNKHIIRAYRHCLYPYFNHNHTDSNLYACIASYSYILTNMVLLQSSDHSQQLSSPIHTVVTEGLTSLSDVTYLFLYFQCNIVH